jgi:heat shock protein HtpX
MNSNILNGFKTFLLFGALTALLLVAGHFIGGTRGVVIGLMFAVVTNFIGYFFSDKIALASMGAREVGPGHPLYQLVQPLAERAGLPMPRVYISPQPAPNAFATGRNPRNSAVCATEGLLNLLDRDEVAGVMAHELAHIKNRDVLLATIAATIGGAISALGYMFMFSGPRHSEEEQPNPLAAVGAIVMLIAAPIAAALIQMAISRSREFKADRTGAELCGNPMFLATALEKVHMGAARVPLHGNPSFNALMIAPALSVGQSMAKLFSTHPPLEDRIMSLIGQPSTGMLRGGTVRRI